MESFIPFSRLLNVQAHPAQNYMLGVIACQTRITETPCTELGAMCCGAGVSPAFLQCAEIRKTAGETPAPRKARILS